MWNWLQSGRFVCEENYSSKWQQSNSFDFADIFRKVCTFRLNSQVKNGLKLKELMSMEMLTTVVIFWPLKQLMSGYFGTPLGMGAVHWGVLLAICTSDSFDLLNTKVYISIRLIIRREIRTISSVRLSSYFVHFNGCKFFLNR